MSVLTTLCSFALTALLCTPLQAKAIKVDASRAVYLNGEVGLNALQLQKEVLTLANQNKEPIALIINSPGGSIVAGYVLINAIGTVRARGIAVNCIIGSHAMSMAFNIAMYCTNTYAFKHTLLLWHPPRVEIRAALTPLEARLISENLEFHERVNNPPIIKRLGLSLEFFIKHYIAETMWTGAELEKEIKGGSIQIIDFVEGVDAFGHQIPKKDNADDSARRRLAPNNQKFEITWIKR